MRNGSIQYYHRFWFAKGAKDEKLAKFLEFVLNQILVAQATEQIKAGPYERTEERQDYRNGYHSRSLVTRVGTLTLRVPRLRNGKFTADLFNRYQRNEQALLLALMEMVVNGVSTRKIEEFTYELCGTDFEFYKNLDPIITAWNSRLLKEKSLSFAKANAGEFFSWLKQRRLHGADLIVSDNHSGLIQAIRRYFQGATWKRCQTNFMRNILDKTWKLYKKKYLLNGSLFWSNKCQNSENAIKSSIR